MHHLTELPMTLVTLQWKEDLSRPLQARQLRGAIAAAFPEDPIFHQHEGGRFLYRYPRVQYRRERGTGVIMGIEAGAERLRQLGWLDLSLRLGDQDVTVEDVAIDLRRAAFGLADRLERYLFRSPWLPFNQENYQRYQSMGPPAQRAECDRLLVAQILSALRGLKIDFTGRLYAAFERHRVAAVTYKDQVMMGLCGHFLTNARLPDDFAIGRAVSHGYGWFVRDGPSPSALEG